MATEKKKDSLNEYLKEVKKLQKKGVKPIKELDDSAKIRVVGGNLIVTLRRTIGRSMQLQPGDVIGITWRRKNGR